jgi:hypothetical protein
MTSSRIADGQVWHATVSGADSLGIQDVYALVVYDPVDGWHFERLLFDVEAEKFMQQ